ncbi:hypothetical protein CN558_22365 [Bacillus wiedmannii]|uniref:CPBP family intramembrane glutamic endopeptidase n=1 Tax=Bacillus wiedmannii TaxID=1890302 RepID=UPI000BF04685|nr:CPBP family intramembrane glutamic endopeptidase [Bacillus wiedmannii]PEM85143.1 hypothetical protein CN627_20770 [Bacillus wiedmannii]PEO82757.1 hypothetical protein CN558_22365 [Bacillus wiedmannii]
MQEQPYIFKKQLIALCTFFCLFLILYNLDTKLSIVIFFFCLVIIFITFVPSLWKRIQYSMLLNTIIYYLPLYLPCFFIYPKIETPDHLYGIALGFLLGFLLLLSNYKHNKRYVSNENYQIFRVITLKRLIYDYFKSIYSVVGEELFFRYFLIGYLFEEIGFSVVVLSTSLFVLIHYLNRWANLHFNLRSYMYHALVGLSLSVLFIYTQSILGCIIAHLIFNSPHFVVILKRYKNRKAKVLFDDY